MKKILVMPVKNEGWILRQTLTCASLWFDHIIIADQGSTDDTASICREFPRVILIDNPLPAYDEGPRRQLLLDAARQFDGNNLIFALDADEVLSADALDNPEFNKDLGSLLPGQSLSLPWIQLWGDAEHYNTAYPWGNSRGAFAYCDDRKLSFGDGRILCSRSPEASLKSNVSTDNARVLHFQFVDTPRMMSKQAYYRIFERLELKKSVPSINWKYYVTKDRADIKPVPENWIAAYKGRGISLNSYGHEDVTWQDVQVLKTLGKTGADALRWLDIWDIDWKKKLALAINSGLLPPDISSGLSDPRSPLIRFYHSRIQPLISSQRLQGIITANPLMHRLFRILRPKKNTSSAK